MELRVSYHGSADLARSGSRQVTQLRIQTCILVCSAAAQAAEASRD